MNTFIVGNELRGRVRLLASRLGPVQVVAAARWQNLARQFDLDSAEQPDGAALVVGSPAEVLKHGDVSSADFGFVMPVAQMTRWWQRAPSWRDDATLELWRSGWTPLTVDRLLAPTAHAVIEFVVGSARRTPSTAVVDE